jgi:homoserine kinase
MIAAEICVRVPATTANLGPGFDCLALTLDLWNTAIFQIVDGATTVEAEGEGADLLPRDLTNLILQAAKVVFDRCGQAMPGLRLRSHNHIPLGSGLGSSAAANLLGLLGANALLGAPLQRAELLDMAVQLEGHPDNAAAALFGGLVVIVKQHSGHWLVRRFDLPVWQAAYVLPEIDFPTQVARAALPRMVTMGDAVFNIGRSTLAVEALRSADSALLSEVMEDRLHQPYRLPLISGSSEALSAARHLGAAAVLSGAGPSVIAFVQGNPQDVSEAMIAAFQRSGVGARAFALQTVNRGAEVF